MEVPAVPPPERLHRDADHVDDDVPHLADLLDDRRVRRIVPGDLVDLRDVHRLVADPLEVQARVDDDRDQPKVGGDGSLEREQRQHPLVELEVDLVDLVVGGDDGLRLRVVVLDYRLDGLLDGGARELAEREQAQLHRLELLVEVEPRHQPNRPVT